MKAIQNRSIKQNAVGLISYVILELIVLATLSRRDWSQVGVMHIFNLGVAVIFVILFFKSLLTAYISLDNGNVCIFYDTLVKKRFSINEIGSVEIEVSPFSKSYFLLRDGRRIKFDAFGVSRSDLDLLMELGSKSDSDGGLL